MTGWLFELWRLLRRPPPPAKAFRGQWSARRLPTPSREAMWLYSGGSYTDELARQIRLAKYARHWPSVLALRARLIHSQQSGLWAMRPVLIPMPSDPQRLCERGFHLWKWPNTWPGSRSAPWTVRVFSNASTARSRPAWAGRNDWKTYRITFRPLRAWVGSWWSWSTTS